MHGTTSESRDGRTVTQRMLQASILAAACAATTVAMAATLTWDANPSTAGNQVGDGFWTLSGGGNNWLNGSTNVAWVDGSDVIFAGGGTQTLTINGGTVTANSIRNNQGPTTTINSSNGSLQLGAGGMYTALGPITTINADLVLGANQIWTVAAGVNVNGVISGDFGFTKAASSTLTLSATSSYTGATTVSGGQLTLSGAGGKIATSSGLTISSGDIFSSPAFAQPYVLLDNSTTNANGRIGGSLTVGMAGKLRINGNSSASSTDTVGALTVGGGQSTFEINGATAGQVVQLSASGLARADQGTAAIFLQGPTAATQSKLTLTAAPSGSDFVGAGGAPAGVGTTKNLSVVPWLAIGNNVSSQGTIHLATYDTTAGSLRRLDDNEYDALTVGYTTDGNNVSVNGAITLTGATRAVTVNALRFNGSYGFTGRTGDSLVISSGALVNGGTSSIAGFDSVSFGNGEAVLHTTSNLTISSPIAVTASGGLTKAMGGTLILGADNTYSGATVVNGGTLQVGTGSTAGNLGTGSSVVLNGGNLVINRSDAFSYSGAITGAAVMRDGTAGKVTQAGTGTTTLSGTNVIPGSINVTNGKLVISGSTTTGSAYSSGLALVSNLIGGGSGTLSTLELTGTGSLTANNGVFKLAETSGARARAYVPAGAAITSGTVFVGNAAGAAGAIYQSGGTVTSVTSTEPSLAIGASGGYGYYEMSGGTMSPAVRLRIAQGTDAKGVLYQTGGTINITGAGNFDISGGGSSNGYGVYYMTGGSFTAGGGSNIGYTTGRAEMTIDGSAYATANFTMGNSANINGILNLNGGTLQCTLLQTSSTAPGAGYVRQVNFDGGTLKLATGTNASQFINASANYSVYIREGGATFDVANAAGNATISEELVAPTGAGIAGTTYTIADGGSGYVGAPIVSITGAPGATAVANMVDDGMNNGTFKVASITITNPGVEAGSPAFTFLPVAGSTAATPVELTTTANATTGGITKVGPGKLTLSAANTYGGETVAQAGTLVLTATGTINNSSALNVKAGATFDISATKAAGYYVNGLKGGGTVLGKSGQALTVGAGILSPGDSAGTLNVSAGNLALTNGLTYNFEVDGTTALPQSDMVNIASGSLGGLADGNFNLHLSNLGSVDPTDMTFVLFDYTGTNPLNAGTWTIDYGTTGWENGSVSIDTAGSRVVLTGLTVAIPEPSTIASVLGIGLLALRGRRTRAR